MNFYLDIAPKLLDGAVTTIALTFAAMALALAIGLVAALGKLSRVTPVRWVAYWYVEIIRGTPLLVQLFLIYFGLPQYGIQLNAFVAGALGLGINYGAYLAEVFRAGILSVPRGQREAGECLGLSERQIMRKIVLPQAFKVVLPPVGNYFISLIKDSALASTITVMELMRQANLEVAQTFRSFDIYLFVALIYFLISFPISRALQRLERNQAAKG
jgi:ectoine/hydroxyectoine ABC transporter permease protein EhuD